VAPSVSANHSAVSAAENTAATNAGSFADFDDAVTLKASTGSITQNANGTWSWSGTGDELTPYTVTVTATNADSSTATTTFGVSFTDTAPGVSADNAAVTAAANTTATNTGTFTDYDDAVSITASTGTVTQSGSQSGTWSWSGTGSSSSTVTITAANADGSTATTSFGVSFTGTAPSVSVDHAAASSPENATATNTGSFSDSASNVSISASTGTVTQSGSQSGTWSWSGTGDESSPYTVTITATATDGSKATTSFGVSFTDVAPSVAADHTSVTVPETQSATNTGTFADHDEAVTITASTGTVSQDNSSGTWSWSGSAGDDSSETVTITATNADGATSTTSFTVTFSDVAPTPSISGAPSSSIKEGTAVNLTGSASNPNPADSTSEYVYTWTVTRSGLSGDWGSASGVNLTTYSFTPNHAGLYTVTLTVGESGGATASTSQTITVSNVPPSAFVTGLGAAVPGQTLDYAATFTDPGIVQPHGETYTYLWKLLDSSRHTITSVSQNGGTPPDFSILLTSTGTYYVSFKVTDDSGGYSAVTKTLQIKTLVMEPDPQNSAKTALYVGGTTGNDTISVQLANSSGYYAVNVNGVTSFGGQSSWKPTGHIVIYGVQGNDTIDLLSNSFGPVAVPALLFGSVDGSNTIDASGSSANNALVGGGGSNNVLYDGSGYNLLIGGPGTASLNTGGSHGNQALGNDILLGADTVYDANTTALLALMSEWDRTDISTNQKITDLTTVNAAGSKNGAYVLVRTGSSPTITNTGAVDTIFSNPLKQNWLP
jgi:hypothetical protein